MMATASWAMLVAGRVLQIPEHAMALAVAIHIQPSL